MLFRSLYDTYGFPMDLTGDIARERNLTLDEVGFEREMDAQRVRARSASAFGMDYNSLVKVDVPTEFLGYGATRGTAKVVALYKDGQAVDQLSEGEEGVVILDKPRSTLSPAGRSAIAVTSKRPVCALMCAIPLKPVARSFTTVCSLQAVLKQAPS